MSEAPDGGAVRPRFEGTAGAMFPMVLKGLFLTVVTLGIYRFWYVTDVRRFLWNGTSVEGDGLEYTGRGAELFIGFLIALAVLIPLYGLVFLAGLVAGEIGQIVVPIVQAIAILFLAQYALYRARRYRLTRTIWRGIRFQQSGSGWAYAGKSFGWGLLSLVTLGLAYPFMRASLERYKMINTWYGDQKGVFSATGGQLFRKGILLWLLAIVLLAGPAIAAAAAGMGDGEEPEFSPWHLTIVLGFLGILIILPLYQAIEFRWWANGCSVGPATAQCDLGLFAFFKVYLGYLGILLLFSLAVSAVGGVIFGVFAASFTGAFDASSGEDPPVLLMIAGVVVYFFVGLVLAALWQLYGVRPIWRKSFESVALTGLGALMAAQSLEPEASAFGEGVADALDFGGF